MAARTQDPTKRIALDLELDMRKILAERTAQLARFEEYINSWAEAAENGEDPRELAQVFVVERAMEQVKDATTTHDGGTSGMHVRMFNRRALELLASARR